MVNYSNGKIYKIVPLNGEDGDIYIGSTTKQYLSQRKVAHISDYKRWLLGKRNLITSFKLFDKYGIDNCNIILLETVDANSSDELHAREAFYISSMDCVNKCIPNRTQKEYYEDNKDKIQQYAKLYNHDYSKKYCIEHKEEIKEKKKIYRQSNVDKSKEYQQINAVKINAKRRENYALKKLQTTI